MRLGIAGLGVVGAEVARQIQAHHPDIQITAVCARDKTKDRGIDLSNIRWVNECIELVRDDVDVVVELIGGTESALHLARATLRVGKPLITANKAMLAQHWNELFSYGVPIMFEASVCGGIPIIKVLREGLTGNRITRIEGILNGTCNYILSTMETSGRSFDDVLAEAQRKGYAEADPSLDIDGWDAAHKLVILAKLAFNPRIQLNDIKVTGIRNVDIAAARAAGKAIRLIATADASGLSVAPQQIALDHPLAAVTGAMNAVSIKADPVDICTLIGPGAGAGPTASAVLADIIDVYRKF